MCQIVDDRGRSIVDLQTTHQFVDALHRIDLSSSQGSGTVRFRATFRNNKWPLAECRTHHVCSFRKLLAGGRKSSTTLVVGPWARVAGVQLGEYNHG